MLANKSSAINKVIGELYELGINPSCVIKDNLSLMYCTSWPGLFKMNKTEAIQYTDTCKVSVKYDEEVTANVCFPYMETGDMLEGLGIVAPEMKEPTKTESLNRDKLLNLIEVFDQNEVSAILFDNMYIRRPTIVDDGFETITLDKVEFAIRDEKTKELIQGLLDNSKSANK